MRGTRYVRKLNLDNFKRCKYLLIFRFQSLHGKSVYHPILKKEIPIVCDENLVDMEFGTGVVKVDSLLQWCEVFSILNIVL